MGKVLVNALLAMVVLSVMVVTVSATSSFDDLVSSLDDADWQVRRQAILEIAMLEDVPSEKVISILRRGLADADGNVQRAAIRPLISQGSAGAAVLAEAALLDGSGIQRSVIDALGQIGSEAAVAVPTLIKLIDNSDTNVRATAVQSLGRIGDAAREALRPLALTLGEEFRIASLAERALSQIDPDADIVALLLEGLENGDEEMSVRAIRALGTLGSRAYAAVPQLILILTDESANLRVTVAEALADMGNVAAPATPYLVEALDDECGNVRRAAVSALGQIAVDLETIVPAIAAMVVDSDLDVRRSALQRLRLLRNQALPAAPYIALATGDEDEVMQRMASDILVNLAVDESIVGLVSTLVKGSDVTLQLVAIDALGLVSQEKPRAASVLMDALAAPSEEIRIRAVVALGNLERDSAAVVPALVDMIRSQDLQLGLAASVSLERIAPEVMEDMVRDLCADNIPILFGSVVSSDPKTRDQSAALLRQVAQDSALAEVMLEALINAPAAIRLRAVRVLAALGSTGQGAVPALVVALVDRDAEVKREAEQALRTLSQDASMWPLVHQALLDENEKVQQAARQIVAQGPPLYSQMDHETMTMAIGQPAILNSSTLPLVNVYVLRAGELTLNVLRDGQADGDVARTEMVSPGQLVTLEFPSDGKQVGTYQVDVKLMPETGLPFYDAFFFTVQDGAGIPANSSQVAYLDPEGRLVYVPDYKGNILPNFSHVGYMGGGVALPDVPVKAIVEAGRGDDTNRIQAAIDQVSRLPVDEQGFRGAVLLKQGVYEVQGSLAIRASGVVLRGEGAGNIQDLWLDPQDNHTLEELKRVLADQEATVLIATGPEMRILLTVRGTGNRVIDETTGSKILDAYVPVGAKSFRIADPEKFEVGDTIIVRRMGNADWISEIGMDRIPPRSDGGTIVQWTPFHLDFEHTILAIEGNRITVDSSVVNAIAHPWGGGHVFRYSESGRIRQVGVENLRAISFWQPNADGVDDTRHADRFLLLDDLRDAWVRDVALEHFYSTNGAIQTGRGSIGVTIQDSSTLIADRSWYAGPGYDSSGRTFFATGVYVGRYGFDLRGQHGLVLRSYALNNRHGFTLGSRVTGPNAFVDCLGEQALTWSEPHHRWSVGGLYDNVDDLIAMMNRLSYGTGHGWAGANYVAWNTRGTLVCEQPPTAQNWAIGHVGVRRIGPFQGPDGFWDSHGQHVQPRSLYLQQLQERLGIDALTAIGY